MPIEKSSLFYMSFASPLLTLPIPRIHPPHPYRAPTSPGIHHGHPDPAQDEPFGHIHILVIRPVIHMYLIALVGIVNRSLNCN